MRAIRQKKKKKPIDVKESRKNEKESMRQQIFKLTEDGFSPNIISKQTGIDRNFVNNTLYNSKTSHLVSLRSVGQPRKFQDKHLLALNEYVTKNLGKLLTVNLMKKYLEDKFQMENFNVCNSTIRNMLKSLKITRKRSKVFKIEINSQKLIEQRKESADQFVKYLNSGFKFVYIDETSFNTNLYPLYGYSKTGESFKIIEEPRKYNLTLIAAITSLKLLCYKFFKDAIKGSDFGAFILEVIENNPEIKKNLNKTVFYFDGAGQHRANILKDLKLNINTFQSVPYSPFLNPIESVFSIWKHHTRKLRNDFTLELIDAIIQASQLITSDKIYRFIGLCYKYWLLSYCKQNINL